MQMKWKKIMVGTLSVCMLATCVPGVSELGSYVQTSEVVQAATAATAISGKCGKKATWKYDKSKKVLTIGGSGAMYNYNYYYDEKEPFTADAQIIESALLTHKELVKKENITILEPRESRMIRRIVEKRMCQEYHKQHKEGFHSNGNKSRHQMKRAVSYQLYNIGQMEGEDIHRDSSTHWKWKYDRNLKEWVLKKKVAYKTIEEAEIAAVRDEAKAKRDQINEIYNTVYNEMEEILNGITESIEILLGEM